MPRKGPRCPGTVQIASRGGVRSWRCNSSKFEMLRDRRGSYGSARLKCVHCGTEFSTRARHLHYYTQGERSKRA